MAEAVREFTPEAVAEACDMNAATIRTIAREPAAAPTAAVYGRIGSCTVAHGTLAGRLVDVLNILTGNLDRPGGALFPLSGAAVLNGIPVAVAPAATPDAVTQGCRRLCPSRDHRVDLGFCSYCSHVNILLTLRGAP